MKKSYSLLLVALFVHILSLTASHSIRLKFQPDFPIDSIRVDNLDNNTTYTFMGGEDLQFFWGAPTALFNPNVENAKLSVFSSSDRNEVQIGFSQQISGITTCEVYNLQGKLMDKFSGLLESSYHRFTFVPDSRGVFLVRVSSPSSIRTSKFVSYGASSGAKLKYDGITETSAVNNETQSLKTPSDQNKKLVVRQNDLLRISCFSGTKAQTIYDYASGDKNYTLRFTDRYNHFRLYNIVASKPSFVDVMFAVTDATHLGVDDLNNLDFIVKENGSNISANESFRHVLRMNQVPFKIILLIDNSVSIVNDLEKVKQSAKQFVNKIRPNQQIAVYVFSDQPYLLQDFTVDTSKLQQAIDKISLGFPSTNLYGSMITALSRWTDEFSQTNFQQGAVILFTDGDDTQGSSTLNQVITARGQKKVYVIGLGSDLTPSILNQISYPKPYVPIKSINDLESSFAEIQADIVRYSNSFYWLNYMSPKRTGKHTLSISTSGNKNPYNTSSITGEYSATGFQSVNSGVYVNIADTKLYGIDTVFCFYDGASYNFTNSRYGAVISEDSLVLKPTTYWAFKQPEYSWSVDNLTNFKLNNASYSTKVIKGVGGDTIITNLNVQDQANSYAKQLSLQMHPENPLFNIVSPDDVTERTVTLKGAVLNEGRLPVLSKGFVWNTSPNPTVLFSPKTNSGNGKGSIQAKVNDLKTGTQYYVKVYASNSQKTFYSEEHTFTTAMSLAELTTSAVTNIAKNSALSGGIITHDGGSAVTARGVCWSTTPDPTINDSITKDGTGIGYFTSVLSGLNGGTTYYVKAYATSSIGTAYGTSRTFTTLKSAPVLTTNPVESITTTTAITGGNITHDGGAAVTERGVCWSTTPSPTINNSKQTAGTGKGSFTNTITGLKTGTQYYIRSYARNSVGTAYGEELSFTTSIGLPELSTKEVTDITKNSALLGGTITHDGGRAITARGVCYSRLPNPTVNDSITTEGEGVGSGNFTSSITGLKAGTVYYVRAYASNSLGTSYGASVTFTTLQSTPELTSKKVQNITSTTAESGGIITHNGGTTVTAKGVCWSTTPTPTVNDSKSIDGSGEGEFTSSITGLKTGTTYFLRAYATNSIGTAYGEELSFTTSIGLPELTTKEVTDITINSALLGGIITHDGGTTITSRGVCYSRLPNPTINDSITTEGVGSGSFTSLITGLKTGTVYYVRVYASNSLGTSYGASVTFTTLQSTPELTSKKVQNITSTTAESGGIITHDGGAAVTARGVCWSTSPTPTVNNSKTTDGSGEGEFLSSITGLKTGTTYYLRAYATNSIGTAYGDEFSFTTSIGLPELTTKEVTDITINSALLGGSINHNGGTTITSRGVCYSRLPNPTINDSITTEGVESGSFTSLITGLKTGTVYYVRAYATNNLGTSYGAVVSFTTLQTIPELTSKAIKNITSTSAESGGVITHDGGAAVTARGVCWSTSPTPTVNNSKTTDGSGEGEFLSSITGLKTGTTYYLRVYATNSIGTAYGDNQTFTTSIGLPELTTTAITITSFTSANSGGKITHDGGSAITARGVCWSTLPNPTVNDSLTKDGTGKNEFTSLLSGLHSLTTYYVRSYATNHIGTAYGNELAFSPIVVVENPATGKKWMDRNLGADRAATSSNDYQAYGDLYQWGRATDGHEKRTSQTTNYITGFDTPGHNNFITAGSGSQYDWRSPRNNNLWQGVEGTNNPCPDGFRIPTEAEWDAELLSWSSGAFTSPLKLPVAGRRIYNDGSLEGVGSSGYYWSCTVSTFTGSMIQRLEFRSGSTSIGGGSRAWGFSVRCIKD